jgi:hypothetical protein
MSVCQALHAPGIYAKEGLAYTQQPVKLKPTALELLVAIKDPHFTYRHEP